jgi:Flp pilus assembly pilin Flp
MATRPGSVGRARAGQAGQSVVEYMLVVAVIAVALAVGFIAFGESARGVFDNVRRTVQMPYP